MKHISTCHVTWTNKSIATGHLKIHNSSISVLSTAKDWLSCVGSHLRQVLAPYLFEDSEGAVVSVTSERCVAVPRNFCEPELGRRVIDLSSVWFQQGGATAHTATASMCVLREMSPQHVISSAGNVPWPARSPDLSACDYFLWGGGHLKSRVFMCQPWTIVELQQSIKEEIAAIPDQMIRWVMENLRVRLKQRLRNGGRHFSDVLSKT